MKQTSDNQVHNSILKYIIAHRQFTIPELSQAVGYSMTTVSKYVAQLVEKEILSVYDQTVSSGKKGRRAVRYALRMDTCYFLGVDVKAFELSIGVMNLEGEIVRKENINGFVFDDSHYKLEEICHRVKEFINNFEGGQYIALAYFNIGGRVNSRLGTSASIFNFEDAEDEPLADRLSKYIGIPAFIENDTKAMAYGEYASMSDPGYNYMLYVNISWGIGLGIIIDGEIYCGKDGYAGEFGHIYRYDNNIMCHCGRKGCLETEVSGRAVCRKLKERIYNQEQSSLAWKVTSQKVITTSDITEAARNNDTLCIELISQAGGELGQELAGLINILNPDCIVIGGQLAQVPESCFLDPLRETVHKYAFRLMRQELTILPSRLGNEAGIIGACMLARNKFLTEKLLPAER